MLTLLHISDLHFGPPFLPLVGDALLRIAPKVHADVIVVSGDLTQRARPEQFAQARAFLERLPDVPKVVVPGNHDVPLYRIFERLFNPHGNYRKYISEQLDAVWRVEGAIIVALDSTSPYRAITNGRIHKDQLKFCADALSNVPDDVVKIVVAHHHYASWTSESTSFWAGICTGLTSATRWTSTPAGIVSAASSLRSPARRPRAAAGPGNARRTLST
jgi:3',5'-cyclic AMP phosphodiesterase CpdA